MDIKEQENNEEDLVENYETLYKLFKKVENILDKDSEFYIAFLGSKQDHGYDTSVDDPRLTYEFLKEEQKRGYNISDEDCEMFYKYLKKDKEDKKETTAYFTKKLENDNYTIDEAIKKFSRSPAEIKAEYNLTVALNEISKDLSPDDKSFLKHYEVEKKASEKLMNDIKNIFDKTGKGLITTNTGTEHFMKYIEENNKKERFCLNFLENSFASSLYHNNKNILEYIKLIKDNKSYLKENFEKYNSTFPASNTKVPRFKQILIDNALIDDNYCVLGHGLDEVAKFLKKNEITVTAELLSLFQRKKNNKIQPYSKGAIKKALANVYLLKVKKTV